MQCGSYEKKWNNYWEADQVLRRSSGQIKEKKSFNIYLIITSSIMSLSLFKVQFCYWTSSVVWVATGQ